MTTAAPVFGLMVTTFVLGIGLHAVEQGMVKWKLYDVEKDAMSAAAWDKLSTRAILKQADKDLKTYFLKAQEYALIVREFQSLKDSTVKTRSFTAMTQTMNRLRASPFFEESYRPEYDALWMILTQTDPKDANEPDGERIPKLKVKCDELYATFPEFKDQFKTAFHVCKNGKPDGEVSVRNAIEALEKKLRN